MAAQRREDVGDQAICGHVGSSSEDRGRAAAPDVVLKPGGQAGVDPLTLHTSFPMHRAFAGSLGEVRVRRSCSRCYGSQGNPVVNPENLGGQMPFYVTVPSFGTAIIHSGLADLLDDELPGLPGDRTGRTVLGVGPRPAAQWSLRSGMGPGSDGTRFLSRQDVVMKGVRLRTEEVGTGVLVHITGLGD